MRGPGRRQAEQQVGFNAYALRTSEHPWFAGGLTVRKTGDTYLLACTQQHHLMENREVVRAGTLDEYQQTAAISPPTRKQGDARAETRSARASR